MFVLCIGAIWFYKARMIFSDASLVSFRRINLQDLESSQKRWGAFITECIPLLFSKLHIPLRWILVSYSLSFNLFYLLIVGLLIFRWRLYALGILMVCYYLLFVGAGYFWTNNEIHQSVAYIFLCFGLCHEMIRQQAAMPWQYFTFFLLSGIAIFTHPLAIIVFGFLWGILWLDNRDWPFEKRQAFHYTAILFFWSVLKLIISSGQPYDARRMYGVTHLHKDLLLHTLNGPVARTFVHACVTNYWLSIVLAIVGGIVMLRQRRWLAIVWALMSATGYLVLLHCGFPEGHFLYYLEGEWGLFGLIAGFPVVYYLLTRMRGWAPLVLAILFVVRIGYIIHAAPAFTNRVRFIEQLNTYARSHRLNKILIKAKDSRFEERLIMDWGLATESMTLSALAKDSPQITLCALWPDHPERIPQGNKEMVWNFDKRPASALNPYYFSLDTTHPYVVVPFEDIERELR